MKRGNVVSQTEWHKARLALLEQEKAQTRARAALTQARLAMPWVEISTNYRFTGADGEETLASLFGDADQLIVYHFMFDADWDVGCKSCSLLADHYGPSVAHLAARDVAFVTVSIAPWPKLEAFRKRMGWDFKWVSSAGSDFNRDFRVSFTDDEIANNQANYNYQENNTFPGREAPGISVFAKDEDGRIYHTYSTFSRGLETFIGAYDLLDIVPKGRDEDALAHGMMWVRLHDSYGD